MIERNYGPFLVKKEKRYYELNIIKFSTISVGLMNMGGLFCRVVAKFYKISYLLFLSFSFMSCLLNAFVDEKNHTIFKKFLGFGLLRIRKMGNWEKHVVVIKSLHYYYFLFFSILDFLVASLQWTIQISIYTLFWSLLPH